MTAGRYRALYTAVGGPWHWRDRLAWTDEQLDAYIALRGIFIWVLKVSGREAGYFELQQHSREHVEIVYFGLEPSFMGRGLGGWMLTRAAQEAFALGASRITLHTCTLDSAPALPNYLARGFSVVREECYFVNDDGSPL
ncbi:MAG: GCN5-related N-acetyltransferase [Gemmatimonadetes bacterium]|nr:GCN5-related N-acetyltransferase [Gemmatimonadota bacterium]